MTTYIGTPTSRVDGRAKVTGGAKYAGEFNASDLAYGYVVQSTIAKGRIKSIDVSEALRVEGVLDVLTHENRPSMARRGRRVPRRRCAGEGSPLRPLYDGTIVFNGQPIALVLAEEWETAQFAASLVRVEYEKQRPRHGRVRATRAAVAVKIPAKRREDPFAPPKPRGNAETAYGGGRGAPRRGVLCPDRASQPDGTVCLDGGVEWGRQAHGLRQDAGRAERAALLVRRVRHEVGRCAGVMRLLWAAGSAQDFARNTRSFWRSWRAGAGTLGASRSDTSTEYGLGYRPAMIERLALVRRLTARSMR